MDNLQDLLDNIKAAAQEGQNAAIDAINAIKQSRIVSQKRSKPQPGAEATIEVEPGLTQPKASTKINTSSTIIDDPDNLLQSQSKQGSQGKSNQTNTPNSGQQNPSKQNGTDNNSTSDPASGTDGQGQGQQGQGQQGQQGQGQQGQGQQGQGQGQGQQGQQGQGNQDSSSTSQGSQSQQSSQGSQGSQGENGNQSNKDSKNNSPAKQAPDFEKPKDDHQAPDKQSLAGRKITIGRVLNLAKDALSKVSGFMTEAATPSQASIDRIKKDINDLKQLTDEDITNMSADRFNELISKVLDDIDRVSQVDYSNDLDTRIQKIKQELSDPELIKELNREDSINRQRAAQEAEATKREKEKYTKGHFKTISQFNIKFYRAIKDQVDEIEDDVDTWGAINKHHYNDGIVAKGTHLEDIPNNEIPSVDIYVDCSGSWSDSDIARGEQALHQIMEFERRGEISTHIYYGTNGLFQTKQEAFDAGRGTNFWPAMINNIKAKNTKNVVILTDSDMNYDPTPDTRAVVDGIVYWIWRNGDRGENLVKNLRGRRDNDEFEFKASSY